MVKHESADGARRPASLLVLFLLALSFMIFQLAVLRELRFQLSTIFTITPFLFSSVIALIGLGSLTAGRLGWASRQVLQWGLALLPLLLIVAFAAMLLVAHATVDHGAIDQLAGDAERVQAGDAYIRSVIRGAAAIAVFGFGPVFFL